VGFIKNGKLQGEWIFDSNGNKTAMATYDNGQVRKWF
jgi:antitoxin component YwqK of YwqJK toxin-antitoxin module